MSTSEENTPASNAPSGAAWFARFHSWPTVTALSWAIAALGIALRIRQYLFNRSLWNDEADLALNIITRSYAGLTHPLALDQGAPLGFLWAEKSFTELFGQGEYALRALPLLAGIASVVLFRNLALKLLPSLASLLVIGLFACSPALIYFSSESKQYGVDVAAVIAVLCFFPWLLDSSPSLRRSLLYGSALAVLVWFSFPAVFVGGATSLTLVCVLAYRRDFLGMRRVLLGSALWLTSFALEYVVSLRPLSANKALRDYWSEAFAPNPLKAGLPSTVHFYWDFARGWSYFPWLLWPPHGLSRLGQAAVLLLIVGIVAYLVRRRPFGLLIVAVTSVSVLANLVHEYPLFDRMLLFSVPVVYLTLGGIFLLSKRAWYQLLCVLLVAFLGGSAVMDGLKGAVHPVTRVEERAALAYVQQHRRPGDGVLVEWLGQASYLYYFATTHVHADGSFWTYGSDRPCDNVSQLNKLKRWRRVWLVVGPDPHVVGHGDIEYERVFASISQVTEIFVPPIRRPVDGVGIAAAVLLKIDPSAPAAAQVPVPPWPPGRYGCISVTIMKPKMVLNSVVRPAG